MKKVLVIVMMMMALAASADVVKAMTVKNGNTPEFIQQMEQEFNVTATNEKFAFKDKGLVAAINYGTVLIETDDGQLIMFSKTVVNGKSKVIMIRKVEEK